MYFLQEINVGAPFFVPMELEGLRESGFFTLIMDLLPLELLAMSETATALVMRAHIVKKIGVFSSHHTFGPASSLQHPILSFGGASMASMLRDGFCAKQVCS